MYIQNGVTFRCKIRVRLRNKQLSANWEIKIKLIFEMCKSVINKNIFFFTFNLVISS